MAPSRVVSSRQSMAPTAYDGGQAFFSSQQSSQGSNAAAAGHLGASLNVPATVSRQSHAYTSTYQMGMSGTRGDAGFLKSSQQQNQPYAPPR